MASARTTGTPVPCRHLLTPPLHRRATRVLARTRLQRALRSIALDLLGPCGADELPADMAAWLDETTEKVASEVSDASMHTLIQLLETTIAHASSDLVDRLAQAALRRHSGIC